MVSACVLTGLGPGSGWAGKKRVIRSARSPKLKTMNHHSGERIFNYEIKKSIENCATTHLASTRKKPVQPPQASTALLRPPTRRLFRMSLVNRNP